MKLIVIGIGQSMRRDDNAGLAAVSLWQLTFPLTTENPSVKVELAELPGLELLDLVEGFDAAIIVDAVQSGAKPGTIHMLKEEDLLGFLQDSKSAHGWGVAETLRLGRALARHLPEQILLIGIEGQDFSPGMKLSPLVQSTLDTVAQAIEDSVKIILGF